MTMLSELDARLRQVNDSYCVARLWVGRTVNGIDVDFFGEDISEASCELYDALRSPEVAGQLVSLRLTGPDEGANGTKNWDLSDLVTGDHIFERLTNLDIGRNVPGEHNRTIVGRDYDEDGVLAELLRKSPALVSLTSPSAPSAEFFRVGQRPIRHLAVDSGYDHQGFIKNLAASSCFPELTFVEFGEYNETYMDDFSQSCTDFADYVALFQSPVASKLKRFVWRNPVVTPEQMTTIRSLASPLQFLIVNSSAEYL